GKFHGALSQECRTPVDASYSSTQGLLRCGISTRSMSQMGHGTKPLAVVCSGMRTANMVAHGNVLSSTTEHGISPQLRQRMIEGEPRDCIENPARLPVTLETRDRLEMPS